MPVILQTPSFKTVRNFLGHDFWTPFSRLTYGAYLSHGIFMLFREYNSERGQWACAYDAILLFLAYVAFSYLFSFLMAITVEFPLASIYKELTKTKQQQQVANSNVEEQYFESTSSSRTVSQSSGRSTESKVKKDKMKHKHQNNSESDE